MRSRYLLGAMLIGYPRDLSWPHDGTIETKREAPPELADFAHYILLLLNGAALVAYFKSVAGSIAVAKHAAAH